MIALLLAGLAWGRTLADVREIAVQQAIAVESARASRDAAAARTWVATAESLPAVVGFASVNTGAGFTSFGFPRPVQTQLGAGLRGSWSLVSPADWGAARAARQTLVGQEALVRWAMVDARRRATAGYAALVGAEGEVAALERAVADAAASREAVEGQVQAGLRPTADAARVRAAEAVLRARLAEAEAARTARCAELAALLREDGVTTCAVEAPDWGEAARGPGEHPALAAARASLGTAEGGAFATGGALAPSLSASGTAAWYETDTGGGGLGWSAGLDLSVPLVASGAGAEAVAAARAQVRVAALALEDQERALRASLAAAEARLQAARAARAARAVALEAAEEALALVGARYQQGIEGLTAWLDARRARDDAAVELARTEAALGGALAEVEAARGVGGGGGR